MMQLIRSFILLILLLFGFYFIIENYLFIPEVAKERVSHLFTEKSTMIESQIGPNPLLEDDLFHWVNKSSEDLLEAFGEPLRKDLSAYGYTWWVYTNEEDHYIQFGISDNNIETIYATGNEFFTNSIHLGETYQTVNSQLDFEKNVSYSDGLSSYTFKLSRDDLIMRPLVKLADDVFLQCYFDTITDELTSVRLLTGEVLLKHAPYEIEYRGVLPPVPIFTEDQWKQIEQGMEQQIFLITNIKRHNNHASLLKWEGEVGEVAYLHSKDMAENNYFSHYGVNGDGLKERLSQKEIYYFAAGENIAAQYPDGPAAVEGWLNSEGHRKALLEDEYTHLGVGVYRFYYTQNFLTKP